MELALNSGAGKNGLYLENESFFLAKDIRIDDVGLTLDDSGYPLNVILKFAEVEWLKAKERIKLNLKVFDKNGEYLNRLTDKIVPHLAGPSFKMQLRFENIEGAPFTTHFLKKGKKITSARITSAEATPKEN
jgi:hypothetical protein